MMTFNKGARLYLFPAIFCNCLLALVAHCQPAKMTTYPLRIVYVDKDSAFATTTLQIQTVFRTRTDCAAYVNKLPLWLSSKGYPTASVDSVQAEAQGTSIRLFLGRQYKWVKLQPFNIEKKAMDESGYIEKEFSNKLINMPQLNAVEQRILNYYEKTGYPFAEVFLDSIRIEEDRMNAVLKSRKGVLYHIDSIRVFGKAKITKKFLQHYLGINNGSIYNSEKLRQVDQRLNALPYLQPFKASDISMLGTGALLNVYVAPKRSSQFNFLVGFSPSTGAADNNKLQFTGDVNLDLKNALNTGESILLNWQQLQPQSPKLNLGYQQPYILNSSFGFDFAFDLFKKDSSFLQLDAQLGLQYILSADQSGKLFIQWQNSFLLADGVDTNQVIATKMLPPNIDVSATNVGIDYQWSKTDYKQNPRSGNEFQVTGTVGIKNIKKNNQILSIKNPSFDYSSLYDSLKARSYQLRIKLTAAHYLPLGKQSTLKTALNGGLFSSQDIFRNELFQIGGYRLLRGFNEESIYATAYGVGTAEYRYRLALNSFLFGFTDFGWVKNNYQAIDVSNTFLGVGAGLQFETKFGILNISYAVGERNDVKFNFRESSKIHLGYINYF